MNRMKLFMSIVPHDKGEKLTRAAVESGCGGGTVLMGRGLAKSNVAAVLGVGETTKDIILMIVDDTVEAAVKQAVIDTAAKERPGFGEFFSLSVSSLMKTSHITEGDSSKMSEKENEMISVIVNKGYADDVMAAARKAGAGGGTVINARGTAREDDAKFFGMHIVPEKEMLIIIVNASIKDTVLSAIRELKCLSEPGSGIAFCSSIDDFTLLGKSADKK